MVTRPTIAVSIACTLGIVLCACSSAAPGGTASEAPPAASQPAAPPHTSAPTNGPADLASPALGKWDAFKDRAVEFTKMSPRISELLRLSAAGDQTAITEIARTLKPASDDLVAWLDANPPDECYRASWEPLREGARLTSVGAAAYLADDAASGSRNLMAGGSKIVEAGGTISDSGDRCRAG